MTLNSLSLALKIIVHVHNLLTHTHVQPHKCCVKGEEEKNLEHYATLLKM